MIETIYLDLDGVLCDFVGGACKAHGIANPYDDPKNWGVWDIAKLAGMGHDEFWGPLRTKEFWAELPETAECSNILSAADDTGAEVMFASIPPDDSSAWYGKTAWFENHIGSPDNLILLTNKYRLASDWCLLIDDNDLNCRQFREHGGDAILYPRPWNSANALSSVALDYLKLELNERFSND